MKHVVAGEHEDGVVGEVNDEIAEENIAAQARTGSGDSDLDADGRDDEALMVGETYAEHEQRPIGIAHLVRRVHPAEQTDQHNHEGQYTEEVNLDDHRLAPVRP